MKLAISNIAWNKKEDKNILQLLKIYSISGVEIAPTKIWNDPANVTDDNIKTYKKFWENEKISIVATQAILFGHPELTIFETDEKRVKTFSYIKKMIRLSALLGSKVIVFGSPKNRDTRNLQAKEIVDIASHFFYAIGKIAKSYDIFFCIEPNPKEYKTNFINSTKDAIDLIRKVNHPYFMLHLDSGALTMNNEDYKTAIISGYSYLKHFHISEKNLLPVGSTSLDHKKIAKILKKLNYDKWVSIEMKGIDNQSNDKFIDRALKFASRIYL